MKLAVVQLYLHWYLWASVLRKWWVVKFTGFNVFLFLSLIEYNPSKWNTDSSVTGIAYRCLSQPFKTLRHIDTIVERASQYSKESPA